MSILAPFVCAPCVNMARVSTHLKITNFPLIGCMEMAISIVHIVIYYWEFDDQ
jgi:hypothetical protein